jgi:hypothetical protein
MAFWLFAHSVCAVNCSSMRTSRAFITFLHSRSHYCESGHFFPCVRLQVRIVCGSFDVNETWKWYSCSQCCLSTPWRHVRRNTGAAQPVTLGGGEWMINCMPLGKNVGTHWIGRWVGPRVNLFPEPRFESRTVQPRSIVGIPTTLPWLPYLLVPPPPPTHNLRVTLWKSVSTQVYFTKTIFAFIKRDMLRPPRVITRHE